MEIKRVADFIRSEDEDRWIEVVQCVFKRLTDVARQAECDDFPRTAADVVGRYRVDTNHTWEFGRKVLREYSRRTESKLKAPKPDLFLSFHAYLQGEAECGPLHGDDYIENFGMTRLNRLYEKYPTTIHRRRDLPFGFTPSPCKIFYSAGSVKDREYVHCQAANAAAVCLTLFANAAAGGRSSPILSEIRPVVCMTLVGPRIKVWIAYVTAIKKARYSYRMQCIWEGSLRNVLDNVKLCVIIENLHLWAMNHLRPWLSSCIDQWKRSIDEFEAEHNRYKPERSSEKQPVKPNQSKARVPLSGAIQSKLRNLSVDESTSDRAKTTYPSKDVTSQILELLQKSSDPNDPKARSSSSVQRVLKGRSKRLDTHGRSHFALRRANTLESCLDQDEGHVSSDETSKSSEEEVEEEEEEEGEEEQDDYDDDYEPGSEEEEDEEREENIDIALEQLKRSLRHDRRGRKALDVLLGYWSQHED
ncbi:hypothetical protein BDW02DRAFT_209370 [Decorospora gaudefroyi]|uniref:Uncharacterized protein n=1 Tax=Decorospora gaudefroyi TaxID=184978 RepID=A0A6A5JYG3_9PLEO|nr:hypothetical protein BDW02DRAFT_209370 [Decorospora gaudefroyi]